MGAFHLNHNTKRFVDEELILWKTHSAKPVVYADRITAIIYHQHLLVVG